jgi:16S rRNA G966 N2-methylase RsmD
MFFNHEIIDIESIIPFAMNSRLHSDAQVAQLAASIREFGFTNPVLIDEEKNLIAGHGRVMAARKLGLKSVPAILVTGLDERKRRALVIADNKLAMNATWDEDVLKNELQDLAGDFGELMGFSEEELEAMLQEATQIEDGLTDEDAVPELAAEPVTVLGDVWLLGKHRLMCGDSTSIDAVDKLMDGAVVDMVYTDPPYGISIVNENGHVGGGKLAKVGNYVPIAGDDTIEVAIEAIQVIKTLSAKVEIIWGGNYYANSLKNSSCWIVWDKDNTGNFADAELAWTNQKTAVRIFKHTWNGMIKASEHGQKRVHPTQKPVALAEWCFKQYGETSSNVLDLFCGSGSTLIACESTKKSGYMMELSPHYCDVIVKRWQEFTGKKATHADTGKTFAEHADGKA